MSLGVVRSPVEPLEGRICIKRDDLCAPRMGGNKVRALEHLLAAAAPSSAPESAEPNTRRAGPGAVLTVGGVASTHVLATAIHAASLGLVTHAFRWRHHVNALGASVARAIDLHCASAPVMNSAIRAYGSAAVRRLRHNECWVPFGGTSPLGILGHVNAALELADQVEQGELPAPASLFCPLGTGGTCAGLALGLQIAGLACEVVGVRVGPRTGLEDLWLRSLVARTRRLLNRRGARLPTKLGPLRIRVDHSVDAGPYAQPHAGADRLATRLAGRNGLTLDATYSAKACYAAFEYVRRVGESRHGDVLIWHTFDGRWLGHEPTQRSADHDRMV